MLNNKNVKSVTEGILIMKKIWLLVVFICWVPILGTQSLLLGQSPTANTERQLRSQYRVSSIGGDGVVVRAESMLIVQKDGILALPAPDEWSCNAYKQGARIKQSTMCALNWSPSLPNTRHLQVGEKAYITAIEVKSAALAFKVQTSSDNPNDLPYRATVSFQFQNGYMGSMKLKDIQDTIGEIFALDAGSSDPGTGRPQLNTMSSAQQSPFTGTYVGVGGAVHIQFNPDGSFAQHVPGDKVFFGTFIVNGDTLTMTYTETSHSFWFHIRGNVLYDDANTPIFTRESIAPTSMTSVLPPLKLPTAYASAQNPADKLQLNTDNSFLLLEEGQSYHGTFVANGNTLDLNISETGTKTTLSRQGKDLTDSNAQTWKYQEQSEGAVPIEAMLHNEDIVKMIKAGLDNAIILSKINSSRCKFDTSTDALIQLKKNGINASILKAMMAR